MRMSGYRNGLILLLVATFVAVSLFGVATSFSMDEHGQMTRCPFMGDHAVICPMSFFEHLGSWQNNFIGIVPLFLVLGILAIYFIVSREVTPARTAGYPLAQFFRRQFDYKPYQPLAAAFAQGILHPKLYA